MKIDLNLSLKEMRAIYNDTLELRKQAFLAQKLIGNVPIDTKYIATPVYYKNGKLKKISNSEVDCTLTYEEWIDEIIKQVEHADYLAKKRKVDAKYVAQIEAIIEARRIEYQQLQMPISALKIPRSSRE